MITNPFVNTSIVLIQVVENENCQNEKEQFLWWFSKPSEGYAQYYMIGSFEQFLDFCEPKIGKSKNLTVYDQIAPHMKPNDQDLSSIYKKYKQKIDVALAVKPAQVSEHVDESKLAELRKITPQALENLLKEVKSYQAQLAEIQKLQPQVEGALNFVHCYNQLVADAKAGK